MVDDSAVTNIIKERPDGKFDFDLDGVDIEAYTPVYISGDGKVKPVAALSETEANIKKMAGDSREQAKTGYAQKVAVKTPFTVWKKAKAGGTVAAGDPIMQEYGTNAKPGYYIKFVEATDYETLYAGKCIVGGADEADIEVLLF